MKWRNYGLWVSMASVIYMVLRDMGMQIDLTQWETYVTAILGILATLGVISNPEQGRGYFTIRRQGNTQNVQNGFGLNQGMQQTNPVQGNQQIGQNQLPVQNQNIQGTQQTEQTMPVLPNQGMKQMEPAQQNQGVQRMEPAQQNQGVQVDFESLENTQQNAESGGIDQVQRDFIGAEQNERY